MVLLPLEAEPVLVVRFAFPSVCGLSDSSMTLGLRRCRSKDSLAGPLPDLPQTVALSRAEMLPALQFLNVGRLSGDFRCFALHYYAGQACAVPTKPRFRLTSLKNQHPTSQVTTISASMSETYRVGCCAGGIASIGAPPLTHTPCSSSVEHRTQTRDETSFQARYQLRG